MTLTDLLHVMRPKCLILVSAFILLSCLSAGAESIGLRCASLMSSLKDVEIRSVELVGADKESGAPEYCNVIALLKGRIGVEVLLPTNWNGKMFVLSIKRVESCS